MWVRRVVVYGSLLCLLSVASGMVCHPSASPSGECLLRWTESTPMPESTSDYAAGVLDRRLVIAGGDYWEGSSGQWTRKLFSSKVWAFNPVLQVWQRLPNLPVPLSEAASVVIGRRLFVLGGYTGREVNRTIYTLTQSPRGYVWRYFGAFPFNRVTAVAVGVGTRIYVLGGLTKFEAQDTKGTCCNTRTATNSFMVLDASHPKKGWRQLPPLPGPRRFFFTAVANKKAIWIFGGRYQSKTEGPIENFSRLVFRYDIAKARWQAMKPLPAESPTADPPSPVRVGGKILLITNTKTAWQLDPETKQYRVLPAFPKAVLVDKFVWFDNRVIGAGGESIPEGPRRRSDSTFIGQCRSK